MKEPYKVWVISNDPEWSGLVVAGLSHTFTGYEFAIQASLESLWQLSDNELVIYDRQTLGNPSQHLISPTTRGGAWILANATQQDLDGVKGLISLGWFGFLESEKTLENLHKAIRMVVSGQLWFSREAMSYALRNIVRSQATTSCSLDVVGSKYELSGKEQKVFLYLLQGYSNKEISDQMNVSLSTVKSHVSHILCKTGKQSRSQLATLMIE
ncbi:response regulator transcription factor [Vibrio vulnificus]|nr:response regulator transcription factor [Vibrio vulnificus]EHH1190726.1 response regulator transcription factor [Vibrio vulnificus]EIA1304469.1 response regulator transcription factor [Vibrio vulnificus]EIU7594256.1 response regulator transcription factor [Vibrio vulnificus]EIU7598025.1 response regulator transcription factor [Vibrio vulnificus]